ncbi:hypothetical protein EV1_019517 [Malus domestica]
MTKRSIRENRTGNQRALSQLDIPTINIIDSSRGLNQIDSEERARIELPRNRPLWPRRRRRVRAVLVARRLCVALQLPACGLRMYMRKSQLLSQVLAVTAVNHGSGDSSRL